MHSCLGAPSCTATPWRSRGGIKDGSLARRCWWRAPGTGYGAPPMPRSRSTLHNAGLLFAGQLTSRLVALVYFAILARQLGPDLYGALGLGASLGIIFAVLLEPGLNSLLIRDVARDPASAADRFAELLGYKVAMLGVAWALAMGTGFLLGYRGDLLWAVLFSGGSVLLVAFEDVSAATLVARDRMDLEGLLRFSSKLIIAAGGFAALALHAPFRWVVGSMTASGIVVAFVGLAFVRSAGLRLGMSFHLPQMFRLVLTAWPLALTGVLWLVTLRLDQVLASQFGVPAADIGNYNAAVKVMESLVFVPNAITLAFQPILARAWADGIDRCSKELSLALEAALSLTLPVALGGAVLAGSLTSIIYGAHFSEAGVLLSLQILALPFIAIQFVSFSTLIAAGALRSQAVIVAVNMVVNVAANLLLVPRYGIVGATWAALLGGGAAAITCLVVLRAVGLRSGLTRTLWRPLVASSAMGLVVWSVRVRVPFALTVLLGAVVFGAAFALMGGWKIVGALRTRRGQAQVAGLASAGEPG